MTLYQILGVAKNASLKTITKAYRKLAMELHPDKTKGDPELTAKFKKVQDAFDILSNPERRKRYDETGDTGQPNAENNEALGIIAQELDALLVNFIRQGELLKRTNLVDKLRSRIDERIKNVQTNLSDMEKRMKVLEETAGRFKSKSDNNFLAAVVRAPIRQIKQELENGNKFVGVLKEAYGMLSDFSYTCEPSTAGGPCVSPGWTVRVGELSELIAEWKPLG